MVIVFVFNILTIAVTGKRRELPEGHHGDPGSAAFQGSILELLYFLNTGKILPGDLSQDPVPLAVQDSYFVDI